MDRSSLLNLEEETFNKQFLLDNAESLQQFAQAGPQSKTVVPSPGFCLKTKSDLDEKIFINVCINDDLPSVKDVTDEELLRVIEEQDPQGFRIPMSIGQPHAEVDKSGNGCTAYDVIVNTEFFHKLHSRDVLMGFFTTVVLEGIEYKYNKSLSRSWVILKNKKYLGTMPDHHIRTESKPWIMEMNDSDKDKQLITEVKEEQVVKRGPEPPYTILQEPAEGHPEYLVAEIYLPKVKNVSTLTLDLGEDHILLQTRSNIYHLDIYLPYNIIQEDCGSQFDKTSKTLTITMPVQPES